MTRWERIADRVNTETTPHHTKGEIADWLGISRPALNRRLSGDIDWHYDELEKLAMMLKTTVEELVSDNGDAS